MLAFECANSPRVVLPERRSAGAAALAAGALERSVTRNFLKLRSEEEFVRKRGKSHQP